MSSVSAFSSYPTTTPPYDFPRSWAKLWKGGGETDQPSQAGIASEQILWKLVKIEWSIVSLWGCVKLHLLDQDLVQSLELIKSQKSFGSIQRYACFVNENINKICCNLFINEFGIWVISGNMGCNGRPNSDSGGFLWIIIICCDFHQWVWYMGHMSQCSGNLGHHLWIIYHLSIVQQTSKSSSVYISRDRPAPAPLTKYTSCNESFLEPFSYSWAVALWFYSEKTFLLFLANTTLALTQLDLDAFAKHFDGVSATLRTFLREYICLLRVVCVCKMFLKQSFSISPLRGKV